MHYVFVLVNTKVEEGTDREMWVTVLKEALLSGFLKEIFLNGFDVDDEDVDDEDVDDEHDERGFWIDILNQTKKPSQSLKNSWIFWGFCRERERERDRGRKSVSVWVFECDFNNGFFNYTFEAGNWEYLKCEKILTVGSTRLSLGA